MPPPHPLELAEILELVVAYLPLRSLPACARVSKAWYQVCILVVWGHIDPFDYTECMNSIQNHTHLVKKVSVQRMTEEYAALRFSNLDSLEFRGTGLRDFDATQFIMEHPSVTRLVLGYATYEYRPAFWDALLGFHNLRALTIASSKIFGTNIDKFWQLCTRLERLDILSERHPRFDIIIPPGSFPNLKHFGQTTGNRAFFMEFMRRCPCLSSIKWDLFRSYEEPFVSSLVELLEKKALPDLEHLEAGCRSVTNGVLIKVIQGMPRITTLRISLSEDAFTMDFATLLQPHFANLRVLEVFQEKSIKSRLAQVVMSSCPLLEILKAPCVDALVVAEGKPWVCLKLKTLQMGISFGSPSALRDLQPLVFVQLSKLTWLETWCATGVPGYRFGPRTEELGVDLRIENGLGRLSTLRRLHTVNVDLIDQKMSDAEVDWILQHWKSLEVFEGNLNKDDKTVGEALREKMRNHGIWIPPQ